MYCWIFSCCMHSLVFCEAPCYLVLERCSINEVYYTSQPYCLIFRLFYINISFLVSSLQPLRVSNSWPSGWVGQRCRAIEPMPQWLWPWLCVSLTLADLWAQWLPCSLPAGLSTHGPPENGGGEQWGYFKGEGTEEWKVKVCLSVCVGRQITEAAAVLAHLLQNT